MKSLLTTKLANQIVSFNWCLAWKTLFSLSTWWLQQAFWMPNLIIIQNMILPGRPPEVLTAEIDCFPRSVLAVGLPHPHPSPFQPNHHPHPSQPPPNHQSTPTPPHSPVQLKISVDKSPLNHLEVKNVFLIDHQNSLSLTPMYYSQKKQLIWVFESWISLHYLWSYIEFAPECKELTCMLDPLLYRWGVPPVVIRCVHWTMQRGVLQTWITPQSTDIVIEFKYDQFFNLAPKM